MKSIDVSQANWNEIMQCLSKTRLEAYHFWSKFGPGTTQEVAEKAMTSILSFRPRSTELQQLGLLNMTGTKVENGKQHGIYEAVPMHIAKTLCENRKHSVQAQGMLL